MKRLMMILVVGVVVLNGISFAGTYGGGSGTPEDPFQIWTAEQMNEIGADPNDWDKSFSLMDDISLSAYTGNQFNIIGRYIGWDNPNNKPFSGIFDGNNHSISNYTWHSTDRDEVGLFFWIEGGEIRNLGLIDPNVIGENAVGDTGSLVGYLGLIEGATIVNCYVKGGYVRGETNVGGLVGINASGTIRSCYASTRINGNENVGGLVGRNFSTIINCYVNESYIEGKSYIGGLVGYNHSTIINCYASGSVNGDESVGGLCGKSGQDYITSSYWDVDASGIGSEGNDNFGATGKTTSQLHQQSTFTDWDFINTWNIGENQTYPYLRTHSAADLNKDRAVNLIDLSIMAEQWMYGAELTPAMTYKVGECDMEGEPPTDNELRFTVKVDGSCIDYEDPIYANCCIENGIRLDMLLEGDLITITETELSEGICDCMCSYPTTARLGPFEPETYTIQVDQLNHSGYVTSIGRVEVIISSGQ